MSVAERLITLGFLDHVHARMRGAVGDIALITDRPLALFGEVAKLKSGLLRRMQTIARELRAEGLRLPVIVGIEKSGLFVEHARAIRSHVPPRMLMAPDRDYVERYITFRGSPHGSETYYGRHFFYCSRDRRIYVITVPPPTGRSPTRTARPTATTPLRLADARGVRDVPRTRSRRALG